MSWLGRWFSRRRIYRDLSAEIRAHIEEKVEELVAGGMPREEAEHAARRQFGNVLLTEQRGREIWQWPALDNLLVDVSYALRMLRKAPGFTAIAALMLGLGVGANTAIFSFLNLFYLRPLPYPQAECLMVLESHDKKQGWTGSLITAADYFDLQRENTAFEQTAAWASWNLNLTGNGAPTLVQGGRVSWNFFATLGVKPKLGRTFSPDEGRPGAGHVAILGEGLWRGRYAGDPRIIGKSIRIDGAPYTVVGVMPGSFQFPLMGLSNLWTPLALTDTERADRSHSWLQAFGRLRHGATPAGAGTESQAIGTRLEREYPQSNTNMTFLVSPMILEIQREEGAFALKICFWIVGLILLIASANVASLMHARASGRAKELAMRGALGASRGRLARQMLVESLVLFLLGGVAGVLFGGWALHWIEMQIPDRIRGYLVNYGQASLDWKTLAFTLAIAAACGIAFGLAPAIQHTRIDLNRTLKEASGQASGAGGSTRLRRAFVVGEIALAVVVIISTTLLVRGFLLAARNGPGFQPAGVLVVQVSLPKTKYSAEAPQREFEQQVLARLRALPGVASAGAASAVPFGDFGDLVAVEAVNKPAPRPGEAPEARFTAVSSDYFSTMRIALLQGRFFTSADGPGTAPVAIINSMLAAKFWPNEDPIGQKFRFGDAHTVATIMGVVNGIKMYQLEADPEYQMYVPLAQFPSPTLGFVMRTQGSHPTAMAAAVRNSIWAVDGDQPLSSVQSLDQMIAVVETGLTVVNKLMIFSGILAMLLGAIGIYGLASHQVSQRTHEIGIRMALGARPVQVLGMVVGQGMKLALVGVVLGLVAALGVTGLLASLLYGVQPRDPATFTGVAIFFALVAVAAGYLPARRAMRVDPITALRNE